MAGILDQHQDSTGANFGFGQAVGVKYRGQCFTPALAGNLVTIGFDRVKGSQGIKVYIDSTTSHLPAHAVGSELYSFTITNANVVNGYSTYDLPTSLSLTTGTEYCFYLAPWDTTNNVYADDYQDVHGVTTGTVEITGDPTFHNENLTFHYATYMQSDLSINISDSSAVTENTTILPINLINISDSSAATDVITKSLLIDSLVITESISVVTESVTGSIGINTNTNDSSTVTDFFSYIGLVSYTKNIVVSDSSAITDIMGVLTLASFQIVTIEFITPTDIASDVIRGNARDINISDSSAVWESFGSAVNFDGSTGKITTSLVTTAPIPTISVTLAAWFRLNRSGINSGSDNPIITYGYTRIYGRTTNNGMHIRFDETTNHEAFDGTGFATNDTAWHHVIGTYQFNGGNNTTLKIYVDGILKATTNSTALPNSNYGTTNIVGTTSGGFLEGEIADVRIYHYVFDNIDVTNLYSQGINPITPQIWYPMINSSGTSITDFSGSGNTGTLATGATLIGSSMTQAGSIKIPFNTPVVIDRTSNVLEGVTIAILNLLTSLSENSAVTESLTIFIPILTESVSDSSAISENLVTEVIDFDLTNDASTVTDICGLIILTPSNQIGLIEFITPTEFLSVLSGSMLNLSAFETSTITDIAGVLFLLQPRQTGFIEFVTPTESYTIVPSIPLVINDSSTATELVTINILALSINVNDTSSVTEQTPYQIIQQESLSNLPVTGTIKDNASWNNGGYIVLTPSAPNQHGEFEYSGNLPSVFEVLFDVSVTGQADAIYFYWGCNLTPANEDAFSGGYIFALDEYSGENHPYRLQFNGTELSFSGSIDFADSIWHTVRIEVVENDLLTENGSYLLQENGSNILLDSVTGTTITVFLDNVQKFSYTDTTRSLPGSLFGWGARTGLQTASHFIRNTQVSTLQAVKVIESDISQVISDASSVTESLTINITKFISVFDASVVTESLFASSGSILFDASLVDELVIAFIPTITEVVSDASSLSESINVIIFFPPTTGEDTTVTDVITNIRLIVFINTFESSVVIEGHPGDASGIPIGTLMAATTVGVPLVEEIYVINVSDSSSVSENILIFASSFDILFEVSTVTENSSVVLVNLINSFDSSNITENISRILILLVSLLDQSTATEGITVLTGWVINIFDQSTITDTVSFQGSQNIVVFDSSTITDVIANILSFDLDVVFDSSVVTESLTVELVDVVSVVDNSSVSEFIVFLTNISIFESSSVSESVSLLITDYLSVFDVSSVTENSNIAQDYCVSTSDASTITELVVSSYANTVNVFDSSSAIDVSTVIYPIIFIVVTDLASAIDTVLEISSRYVINEDSTNVGGAGWIQGVYVFTP